MRFELSTEPSWESVVRAGVKLKGIFGFDFAEYLGPTAISVIWWIVLSVLSFHVVCHDSR